MRSLTLGLVALSLAACAREGTIEGPPTPKPELPAFSDAPAIYGTPDDPDKFGPGRARIEGHTFYFIADREMTKVQNDWDYNIFSRRIKYDPANRTLRSDHRMLDLKYDDAKGAFTGTIVHPRTRRKRAIEVTVSESALPKG